MTLPSYVFSTKSCYIGRTYVYSIAYNCRIIIRLPTAWSIHTVVEKNFGTSFRKVKVAFGEKPIITSHKCRGFHSIMSGRLPTLKLVIRIIFHVLLGNTGRRFVEIKFQTETSSWVNDDFSAAVISTSSCHQNDRNLLLKVYSMCFLWFCFHPLYWYELRVLHKVSQSMRPALKSVRHPRKWNAK